MEGQGFCIVRYPVSPGGTGSPFIFTTRAAIPGSDSVAEPGFAGVAPGSGEIMIEPVSVCHQVSTIGQRLPPMDSKYQRHAAGLIDSPTEPRRRMLRRSCAAGHSLPQAMNARMAVGEV